MLKVILFKLFQLSLFLSLITCDGNESINYSEETPVCGGFIEFDESINTEIKKQIDFSSINVQLFTMDMILKDQTNLAASGYYFLPIYDNESFILKISGPNGMNFEPEQYVFQIDNEKSIKEMCEKDINFKFRGYIVEGQVSTFGSKDGPEGITLILVDSKDQTIQSTKTVEKGLFKFKPINPGNYILRPLEDNNLFDKNYNELEFTVNLNTSNFLEKALIIRGFTVSGKVQAEGEALSGITAFIYSYNSTLTQNYNCDYGCMEILSENVYKGLTPFCSVNTDLNGVFSFKNIPYGKFLIKTVYMDKYVSYETVPEYEIIDVEHNEFKIDNIFQVNNFSIYGLVVNSKKNGIPNVTISFEVKPGTYHIKPVLTQDERDSDLHLQPEYYDLEIIDTPLLDVNFYQSKVVLSGKIHCIGECEKDIKVKLISGKTDRVVR